MARSASAGMINPASIASSFASKRACAAMRARLVQWMRRAAFGRRSESIQGRVTRSVIYNHFPNRLSHRPFEHLQIVQITDDERHFLEFHPASCSQMLERCQAGVPESQLIAVLLVAE